MKSFITNSGIRDTRIKIEGFGMAESLEIKGINENDLEEMYLKVVTGPNDDHLTRGFIKCPDCGNEILMIPTLRQMNHAIESHVKAHKELLKDTPLLKQQTAMQIRLDLAQQVLRQASLPDLF